MIRVNCFFKAIEGKYEDALEAAIALAALSQQEEGCIAYDVFESATRGEIFMICETWTNEDALAAHMETEHFKLRAEEMKDYGELKIEKFQF